ncbi:hypothetical protein D3C76_249900 [compost metagenome]
MLSVVKNSLTAVVFLMSLSAYASPWEASRNCHLNKSQSSGIYPEAAQKLSDLELIPRVTQGINQTKSPQNVHGTDDVIDGVPYTAAVDISVRCLDGDRDGKIKGLLTALAENGFVGWYRKNGSDGWSGADHIHAVWVKQKLKPSLEKQVNSWLEGKNGLRKDAVYQYWKPSDELKETVSGYFKKAAVSSR